MPVVSVFVSSTIQDFHGERDALVGPVRAALDERVGRLGCRFEVLDLEREQVRPAGEVFEESLAIARRLAAADADSAQAQRDLSISLLFVGLVSWMSGRHEDAGGVFEEVVQRSVSGVHDPATAGELAQQVASQLRQMLAEVQGSDEVVARQLRSMLRRLGIDEG